MFDLKSKIYVGIIIIQVLALAGAGLWGWYQYELKEDVIEDKIESDNKIIQIKAEAEGWKQGYQKFVNFGSELRNENVQLQELVESLRKEKEGLQNNLDNATTIDSTLEGEGQQYKARAEVNTTIVETNTGETYAKTVGKVKLYGLADNKLIDVIPLEPTKQEVEVVHNTKVIEMPQEYRYSVFGGIGIVHNRPGAVVGARKYLLTDKWFNDKMEINLGIEVRYSYTPDYSDSFDLFVFAETRF